MGYRSDRDWADLWLPQISQIVGPHLLVPTPMEVDCHQAADLWVLKARDMTIAARVRRPGFLDRYRYEFTIRAKRDSGTKTELAKIVDGWCDWLFYGHSDMFEQHLVLWWLVDLHAFRAALIRSQASLKMGNKSNGDNRTHFKWFDLRSFPIQPPILVAGSEPLPPMDMVQPIHWPPPDGSTSPQQLNLGI